MRIVFFGSPSAALPALTRILEEGHSLELIITQPDKPAGRGQALSAGPVKRFALEKGLTVHQPEKIRTDPRSLELLQSLRPDIGVVVAFGQILPKAIIDLPRWHTVNVHFSLLPKYRGASPVAWALLRGETRTGVTIFELDEKMDEGHILSRREIDILPHESAGSLENRLAQAGAELLSETLAARARLPLIPQDHVAATYAPKLKKEDGRLVWSEPASTIDRRVRAFTPWPSAFAFLAGRRLQITQGRPVEGQTYPGAAGFILPSSPDGMRVCCGQGTIFLIERLKPENKKEMSAPEFRRGLHLARGAVLD
ncbi:MAG: methionyl-tRNA formyltransferase [Candidatus Aminicenantes bacterium]|nr:methionyl-tRNA formyltransferase [Candidatus Aminicenantes bacterium]